MALGSHGERDLLLQMLQRDLDLALEELDYAEDYYLCAMRGNASQPLINELKDKQQAAVCAYERAWASLFAPRTPPHPIMPPTVPLVDRARFENRRKRALFSSTISAICLFP